MGESRAELLNWVNNLLELNVTKVEQLGTGAAHCQIIDSIYGDVMLNKVKFDTKQEYEYVANFKVLQDSFTRHNIDKHIPVDRLIKCKFQDNLEFLQWMKKYWESNAPQTEYSAAARRKGAGGSVAGSSAAAAPPQKKPTPAPAPAPAAAVSRPTATTTPAAAVAASRVTPKPVVTANSSSPAPKPAPSVTSTASRTTSLVKPPVAKVGGQDASSSQRIAELEKQSTELKLNVESLEKERDFYFGKLRDIEILIQNLDGNSEPEHLKALLPSIQQILYSTEEGFETPAVTGEEESF